MFHLRTDNRVQIKPRPGGRAESKVEGGWKSRTPNYWGFREILAGALTCGKWGLESMLPHDWEPTDLS